MFNLISIMFLVAGLSVMTNSQTKDQFQTDEFQLDKGILKITFIGHGSLMFDYNGMIIQVDPWSKLADYSKFPKADIILITHEHGDHFDPAAIKASEKKDSRIVCTQRVADSLKDVETIMKNGDFLTIDGVEIVAVPAYNLLHKRPSGEFYHPKGVGNGYVIRFGNKKVYIAGDTENIPEMKNLKNIYIAFLPMNLPYTMTPEMVADAVKMFKPKILYPYHTGDTDVNKLVELMKNENYCEVRVRKMP